MQIKNIMDPSFQKYGTILKGYDFSDLTQSMKHTPTPLDDCIYQPSLKALEALPVAAQLKTQAFGELPIQIGFCNGTNHLLNALEYHRSSELDLAATDLVLLLGMQQDIENDFSYDTSRLEAFLLPAGTGVQLYATTLHYAPICANGKPFQCAIVLPEGTNTELSLPHGAEGEDRLLTARNKWLIAHPDAGIEGACCGLKGTNIQL
ncbi:MAG: DUF4867 family protein [Ruminococcus sp.]|jgi:hypothetical protein